jgi:uncharacterized protein with gpF-like domain
MLLNFTAASTQAEARTVMDAWRAHRSELRKSARGRTDIARFLSAKAPRLASRLASILRRAGRKNAKAAKTALERYRKTDEDVIQSILDQLEADGVAVEVIDEITPEIRKAFEDAHATAVAQVGVESSGAMLEQADQAAIDYAKARAAELVTSIGETTRDDLRSLVTDAVTDGWSSQRLADEVEGAGAFSEYRSEMIARTELAYAHVGGNMAGWRATDVVEKKRWITGAGCCDDCGDLDGVEIDLDEDFDYADGPVDAPPAHPNCRCDVEPVLVEVKEEGDDQEEEG